jgi:hypothetical protein
VKRFARLGTLLVGTGLLLLMAGGGATGADDEQAKGQKKGADTVIQLDLSKLPPELLKQLLQYALSPKADVGKVEKAKGKGKAVTPVQPSAAALAKLPPGLQGRPLTHPGVQAHLRKQAMDADKAIPPIPTPEAKGGNGKDVEKEKGQPGTARLDDIERTLNDLLREIRELRKSAAKKGKSKCE